MWLDEMERQRFAGRYRARRESFEGSSLDGRLTRLSSAAPIAFLPYPPCGIMRGRFNLGRISGAIVDKRQDSMRVDRAEVEKTVAFMGQGGGPVEGERRKIEGLQQPAGRVPQARR